MKTFKLHIVGYFLLIWSFSLGQTYTNYTLKDGLPSTHIYKILQDASGFIWIATDKGLVKYDGTSFKTFTTRDGLATNDVWGLNVTPDAKVWFQSKAPKVGYIEQDTVFAFESATKGEILASRYTNQIGNEIILSNAIRFHKLIQNNWRPFDIEDPKSKYLKLFIQHKNIGALQIDQSQFTVLLKDKNNKAIKQLDIKDILLKKHKRGQLTDSLFYWAANDSYKILNLNTLDITERSLKDEIGIQESKHVRINLVNNQLQISGEGFVGVLDHNYGIKETYYFPKEINAHFGFIDVNKNIWLATFTDGVYKVESTSNNVISVFKGYDIRDIAKLDQKVIATINKKGYYVYDPLSKEWEPYLDIPKYLYPPNYIEDIKTSYFHSIHNTIRQQQNTTEAVYYHLEGDRDMRYLASKLVYFDNQIYGTNSFGLMKIIPNTDIVLKRYVQEGINDVIVFKDRLLLASTSGLDELRNDQILGLEISDIEFEKPILNVHQIDENNILLNTDGFGSYITDLRTIEHIPESKYLIVNDACIRKGKIWLATNEGVLAVDLNKNENRGYNYTRKEGLPTNQINTVYVDDTRIMAGTSNGIAILPNNDKMVSSVLDVYFENAEFSGEPISEGHNQFKYVSNNTLSIDMRKIDFGSYNSINIDYKLDPIHKEWQSMTGGVFSTNNLQPGNYTFTVNAEGKQKELHFTITPLLWQKLWFQIATVFLFGYGVFYVAVQLGKQSQLKKAEKLAQEKKLSEIQLKALRSQMNPHFVFNSLAAIQYYISDNNLELSEKYLVKFSRLIRHFFNLSKEEDISLSEEIRLIQSYLEIEQLRFREKLSFNIEVDPKLNVSDVKIPTMLLQPVVENAVNHGVFNKKENGMINVYFKYVDSRVYVVEVCDDGVGYVNTGSQHKKHNSSNVIADRLEFLNKTGLWNITLTNSELYSNQNDKGNRSTFKIEKLSE